MHRRREHSFLSAVWERHQHIGAGVMWLMFAALGVVIGKAAGFLAGLLTSVVLAVSLEFLYQWVQALRAKNSKKWWARKRSDVPRIYISLAVAFAALLTHSPLARWGLLALAVMGLAFAALFRYQRGDGI